MPDVETPPLPCGVCGRPYKNENSLDAHASLNHRGTPRSVYDPDRLSRPGRVSRKHLRAGSPRRKIPPKPPQGDKSGRAPWPKTAQACAELYALLKLNLQRDISMETRQFIEADMTNLRRYVYDRAFAK